MPNNQSFSNVNAGGPNISAVTSPNSTGNLYTEIISTKPELMK